MHVLCTNLLKLVMSEVSVAVRGSRARCKESPPIIQFVTESVV